MGPWDYAEKRTASQGVPLQKVKSEVLVRTNKVRLHPSVEPVLQERPGGRRQAEGCGRYVVASRVSGIASVPFFFGGAGEILMNEHEPGSLGPFRRSPGAVCSRVIEVLALFFSICLGVCLVSIRPSRRGLLAPFFVEWREDGGRTSSAYVCLSMCVCVWVFVYVCVCTYVYT